MPCRNSQQEKAQIHKTKHPIIYALLHIDTKKIFLHENLKTFKGILLMKHLIESVKKHKRPINME